MSFFITLLMIFVSKLTKSFNRVRNGDVSVSGDVLDLIIELFINVRARGARHHVTY